MGMSDPGWEVLGLRPRRRWGLVSLDLGGVCFSFPDSSGGHPRTFQPQHCLVRVSAGTASPVPESAGRPPAPPPLSQHCKRQVEPSLCQRAPSPPPRGAWLPSPSTHPQAWSAFSLDLPVPLRPLRGEGARVEGRRGAKARAPDHVRETLVPAQSTGPGRRGAQGGPRPQQGTLNAFPGRWGPGG